MNRVREKIPMKESIIITNHSCRTIAASQHGSVLIYIVAVILIAGVLGLGIVAMTTTSTFSALSYNSSDHARFLAKSGLMYALTNTKYGHHNLQDGNSFRIIMVPDGPDLGRQVEVVSTVHPDSPLQKASFRTRGLRNISIFPFADWGVDQEYRKIDRIDKFLANEAVQSWNIARWGTSDDSHFQIPDPDNPDGPNVAVPVLGNVSTANGSGQAIFVEIPDECDMYTIRSIARLGSGSTGGYGIFYDTVLEGTPPEEDPGYLFQFDRGYGDGALQLRRRNPDSQLSVITPDAAPALPDKNIDPAWWTDLHMVEIRVVNVGSNNREVDVTIYDLEAGYTYDLYRLNDFSESGPWEERLSFDALYSSDSTDEPLYTGFRTWGASSFFHYLEIEMICENGETNIDFPDDEESELEDYWDNVGFSDADYSSGGQSDGGALEFKGEDGLLGLAWGEIEGLDLKEIRNASDGLLSYDLQVKTKVQPQGNHGDFYMLGLSFRLETEENSKYNGYGLSFFRYTPNVQQNKRPDWVETLEGFNDLQDGVPYLVLWKKENGGNITLIDYADIQDDHPESFVTGSELNDWVTMAVRVEEKDHPSGEGTENDITAYIEQPPDIEKGEKIWDFSQYIDVNWIINGIGTITDDSLDSSGVDYIGDIEVDPPNYEYEIGVHAFYDGNPANQIFFSDFGLKF